MLCGFVWVFVSFSNVSGAYQKPSSGFTWPPTHGCLFDWVCNDKGSLRAASLYTPSAEQFPMCCIRCSLSLFGLRVTWSAWACYMVCLGPYHETPLWAFDGQQLACLSSDPTLRFGMLQQGRPAAAPQYRSCGELERPAAVWLLLANNV